MHKCSKSALSAEPSRAYALAEEHRKVSFLCYTFKWVIMASRENHSLKSPLNLKTRATVWQYQSVYPTNSDVWAETAKSGPKVMALFCKDTKWYLGNFSLRFKLMGLKVCL